MSIHAYNATQTFVRATPFLVAGAAVASLYPDEVKDFFYRVAHRPAPPLQPKRPHALVFLIPAAALTWLGTKFLPEIKGSIPREALEKATKKRIVPKTISPAMKALIPNDILSELNAGKEEAEQSLRHYVRQYKSNNYIYDPASTSESWWPDKTQETKQNEPWWKWGLREKTTAEKEKDKKIAEAMEAYVKAKYPAS
jgi:hypothetical protein